MSRALSLNARQAIDAADSDEVAVVLCRIDHPDLPDTLRISTDNKDRLSLEPLMYGTLSAWGSDDGQKPFYYIGMRVVLPDDEDDVESTASLVLDVLETGIVELLTTTTTKATCLMAVVMASTPDLVEYEIGELEIDRASGDWGSVAITFSMEHLYDEPLTAARFTKGRFPGLYK